MAKQTKKADAKETKETKESKSEKKPAAAATKASARADAKPQAAKSGGSKSAKPAGNKSMMQSTPLIDTSLAASSAASMIGAGLNAKNLKSSGQSSKPESSLFKQMKSGLNKPHSATMDSLLDKTHGPGTQKTQGGFQKQVAHNQTVGSDAARKSVPRRTAG
jgi:hypothetical protein